MDLSSPQLPGTGPAGSPTTTWPAVTGSGAGHSQHYIERWESFEAEGRDIDGEARLVDAMAPRSARILDAGAGTGRVAAYLAARGHDLTAVDIDPALVDYARSRYADLAVDWHVGDLAVDSGPDAVPAGPFDVIVSAGNVLAFIPDAAHRAALGVLASRLAPGGRLVVGFGLNRGRSRESFLADAADAHLTATQLYSSWDLRPFGASSDFLVAVLEEVHRG
jgi:SAM-dependent methyltransferase